LAQATQRTLNGYEQRKRYTKDHFLRYPERRLKLDYAIARFPGSEIALKTRDEDPRVWFTAKYVPERAQVALHLRAPLADEWNALGDFLDLDIYFPKGQVAELTELLTEPAQTFTVRRRPRVNRVGRR